MYLVIEDDTLRSACIEWFVGAFSSLSLPLSEHVGPLDFSEDTERERESLSTGEFDHWSTTEINRQSTPLVNTHSRSNSISAVCFCCSSSTRWWWWSDGSDLSFNAEEIRLSSVHSCLHIPLVDRGDVEISENFRTISCEWKAIRWMNEPSL